MARVFGLKKPAWIIGFFSVLLVPFSLLIASLASDQWFSQKWTESMLGSYRFKGKILGPKDDLGICDKGDTYKHCYDECESYCSRFLHWYYAGAILVTLDTIGIVILAVALIFLLLELVRFPYFKSFINSFTAGFFLLLVLIFHFLAVVIFSGIAKITYSSCSHDFRYDGTKSTCAEEGFNLSLSALIITSVITPSFFFIFLKFRSQERRQEEGIPLT